MLHNLGHCSLISHLRLPLNPFCICLTPALQCEAINLVHENAFFIIGLNQLFKSPTVTVDLLHNNVKLDNFVLLCIRDSSRAYFLGLDPHRS